MKLCECGCGRECKNKFVHGHNGRGIKRSDEEIKKFKQTLSLPEIKERARENIKLSWTQEKKEYYKKINTGKVLPKEHREKIGNGNRGKIRNNDSKKRIAASLKGRYVGELNPFWRGGTSRCYKTGYYSSQYLEWRIKVFERDNYTCQKCGLNDGSYLTAHHIKSFAHYPDLRFDVNNGETLCESCHSKTDNYKGRNKKIFINN